MSIPSSFGGYLRIQLLKDSIILTFERVYKKNGEKKYIKKPVKGIDISLITLKSYRFLLFGRLHVTVCPLLTEVRV